MATEITTASQDITGDFDLVVRGAPDPRAGAGPTVLKALGAGGTNFQTVKTLELNEVAFVKNTGTNAYKLANTVAGVTVEFSQ